MSDWTLYEGDALEILPTLDCVDHVITDPPYEERCHRNGLRIRTRGVLSVAPLPFAALDEHTRSTVGAEIARLARRWALVTCQVEGAMLWAEAIEPLEYVRTCVWSKPDSCPQFTGDRPGCGWEAIVVAHPKGRKRWNGGGHRGVFTHAVTPAGRTREHPTEKPLALCLELVELFTDPGETILDPFAGSGAIGVAALRLGRRYVGIERNPTYAALARERLTAEASGTTLRASRAGQESLFARR